VARTASCAAIGEAMRSTPSWALFGAGLLAGLLLARALPTGHSDTPDVAPVPRGETAAPEATPVRPKQSAAEALPGDLPSRGDRSAPVVIEAFLDFGSPACARVAPVLTQVLADYPRDAQLVLRHLPEPGRAQAPLAHRAVLAAGQQGKLWEMVDRLFETGALDRAALIAAATDLGVDVRAFEASLDDPAWDAVLERDRAAAQSRDVASTPTFFVNGRRLSGAQPYENFVAVLERERARLR
jgi:protein-disulfide isomerase